MLGVGVFISQALSIKTLIGLFLDKPQGVLLPEPLLLKSNPAILSSNHYTKCHIVTSENVESSLEVDELLWIIRNGHA